MLNKSGLKPVGHAIVVKPYEPELKASVIALPDEVRKRQTALEQRCVIVEIGSECWCEEAKPRAAVGDRVLVTRNAGTQAVGTLDGEQYRIVNDRDVFCVISQEK